MRYTLGKRRGDGLSYCEASKRISIGDETGTRGKVPISDEGTGNAEGAPEVTVDEVLERGANVMGRIVKDASETAGGKMMIRNISALFLLLIISGCAHGLVGRLPTIDDPDNASEIVFIRECELIRGEGLILISIDEKELFKIGPCQYTAFITQSGQHTISMRGIILNYGLDVDLAPGGKYYYLAALNSDISAIPESIAIPKIRGSSKGYEYLQIDNTIGPIRDQ